MKKLILLLAFVGITANAGFFDNVKTFFTGKYTDSKGVTHDLDKH